MENLHRIRCIKSKLETIKELQPNLYTLWKLTIYKQESRLIKTLLECESMLDEVGSLNKTLSVLDIQTLFVLGKTLSNKY